MFGLCERGRRGYRRAMRYTLDEIETFLTVMELGSVTAAAARMNLAKSVISRRIGDFETSLGAALFRRSAGRIQPTEAALRLAERLRPALGDLTAAAESAAWTMDGAASLRGRLALTAPMSFGTLYLSPVLARFAALHPALELVVDYDDRMRDLARDGFDLGIRIGQGRDTAVMQRRLCEDRMVACASPGYLAARGMPALPGDLRDHDVIGYRNMSDTQTWRFGAGGGVAAPVRPGRLSCNNGEMLRDMAIAGLGLAMIPRFIAAPALRDGRLVAVLPDQETRILPVLAVWPPIQPMPAKLRLMIDWLVSELAGGAPWMQEPDAQAGS